MQPQDHIAIYFLTTQLKVLMEFTQDSTELMRALDKHQGFSPPALDSSMQSDTSNAGMPFDVSGGAEDALNSRLEEFLNSVNGQLSDFYNISRAATTSAALGSAQTRIILRR